jgi:hypothetical protein
MNAIIGNTKTLYWSGVEVGVEVGVDVGVDVGVVIILPGKEKYMSEIADAISQVRDAIAFARSRGWLPDDQ